MNSNSLVSLTLICASLSCLSLRRAGMSLLPVYLKYDVVEEMLMQSLL